MSHAAWVLAATTSLIAVGFEVMILVLGPLARAFGADDFQLGLVVSTFTLMRLVSSPFVTRIGQVVRRRNAITLGMTIATITTFRVVLSLNLAWMIMIRTFGGVGSAMFIIAAMNLPVSIIPQYLRGHASGLDQSSFLLDSTTKPTIGGLLGSIFLYAPLYFYSGVLLVTGSFTLLLLPARCDPLSIVTKEPSTL